MNNNYISSINKHIFNEMVKLEYTEDNINLLEDIYVSSPTNSVLIELHNLIEVKNEIKQYLCHISPAHRRSNFDFEPDSIYMIF